MTESVFRAKAPKLMTRLMEEFPWTVEDAAACAGNGGHESGGFTNLQEDRPTVQGSRGGYGWFQWTGPRRKAFEKFCAEMKLLPSSDAGNIAFLIHEMKTTERAAIQKTKDAKTLADKVVAFEKGFERAGVKHYPSRLKWAQIALEAYHAANWTDFVPPKPDGDPGLPADPVIQKPRGLLSALIDLILSIFRKKG
jgi:hypothetical protein